MTTAAPPMSQPPSLHYDKGLANTIVAESERGMSDLYVALTRATRRLGVVHTEPLPKEMHALQSMEGQSKDQ